MPTDRSTDWVLRPADADDAEAVAAVHLAARRSAADGIAALRRTLLDPTEGETS